MRKLLVKIVQLLDGTPAVYGKRQSGQSVVELALITPILIILLAGLVEIGWFANNYLNLLDVSRAGARRGAVLSDQKAPQFWDNTASYVPNNLLSQPYQLESDALHQFEMPQYNLGDANTVNNGNDTLRFHYRWMPDNTSDTATGLTTGNIGQDSCQPRDVVRLFYNEIICTMITSMDPLVMNPTNGIDDIIVSAFSVQTVDATSDPTWLAPSYRTIPMHPQVVVVGRYPTNANECDVLDPNSNGVPSLDITSREGRNPFDINGNGKRDIAPPDTPDLSANEIAGVFTELPGYNDRPAPTDVQHAEKQVGFSLFGNHKIPDTFCVGSEWTMQRLENLMNLSDYVNTNTEKDFLPSQGVVLVEMYWEHEMLLKIPILSPVFTAVGNKDGKMVINVWAAFPLAATEPHIIFPS